MSCFCRNAAAGKELLKTLHGHRGPWGICPMGDANAMTAKQAERGKASQRVALDCVTRVVLALLRKTHSSPLRGSHLGKSESFLYNSGSQTDVHQNDMDGLGFFACFFFPEYS